MGTPGTAGDVRLAVAGARLLSAPRWIVPRLTDRCEGDEMEEAKASTLLRLRKAGKRRERSTRTFHNVETT